MNMEEGLKCKKRKKVKQKMRKAKQDCHAPIPGPTRLADPNRVRGARPYTETLYLFYQTLVYPILITISTYHIQKSKINYHRSGVYSVIYIQY